MSLTRHVPQFPEVQFVGISTPALSAIRAKGVLGVGFTEAMSSEPR